MIPTPTGRWLGLHATHSPDWYATRNRGVTGSEIAAILGLSAWQSRYSLWHTKKHGWTSETTRQQEYGNRLEPVIRDWFADDMGLDVRGDVGTYCHTRRPWQVVNPDALIVQDGQAVAGYEGKTARYGDEWGTPGTDEIPPGYRTQCVWAMDVLGLDLWHVAVSIGGAPPDYYQIKYDPDEARLLRGHAAAFWRSIVHDTPPDIDGHSETYRAVRKLHPGIDGTTVTVPVELARAFALGKATLEQVQTAYNEAAALLLDAMGDARMAVLDSGSKVARRQPGKGGSVSLYNLYRETA